MQLNWAVRRSNNGPFADNINNLCNSNAHSVLTHRGFMTRLISEVAFISAFCPGKLVDICIQNVTHQVVNGRSAILILGFMAGREALKTDTRNYIVDKKPPTFL